MMGARTKSKKRIELIEHAYWTCTIESHRHKTEAVANECIAVRQRKKAYSPRKWNDDVLNKCKADHAAGISYRAIGKGLGVSGARISQLLQKWDRTLLRRELLGKEAAPKVAAAVKEDWLIPTDELEAMMRVRELPPYRPILDSEGLKQFARKRTR